MSDYDRVRDAVVRKMSPAERAVYTAKGWFESGAPSGGIQNTPQGPTPPEAPEFHPVRITPRKVVFLTDALHAVPGKTYRIWDGTGLPTWHPSMSAFLGQKGVCVGSDPYYVFLQVGSAQIPFAAQALEEL